MIPGRERSALQSVRRSLSYVIASAATCAPLGAGTDPPLSRATVPRTSPSFDPESRHRRRLGRGAGAGDWLRLASGGGGATEDRPGQRAIGFEEDCE